MAKAKNKVISGDYPFYKVKTMLGLVSMAFGNIIFYLDNTTVESYKVVIDGNITGVYQVAIDFKDGKRSLIEVDDKIYKLIVKRCF